MLTIIVIRMRHLYASPELVIGHMYAVQVRYDANLM